MGTDEKKGSLGPSMPSKYPKQQAQIQSRSRSNSDLNSNNSINNTNNNSNSCNTNINTSPSQQAISPSIPPTTLRAKLSRNPSTNSVHDSTKSKLKMKLQLSNTSLTPTNPTIANCQTTPVLLSPRGTPITSPDFNYMTNGNTINGDDAFFANFESSPHVQFHHQSHLDNLLDESDSKKTENLQQDSFSDNKSKNVMNNFINNSNSHTDNNITTNMSSSKNNIPSTNSIFKHDITLKIPGSSKRSSRSNSVEFHDRKQFSSPSQSKQTLSPSSTIPPHSKASLHQLQTHLQRLPSNNNVSTPNGNNSAVPRSPLTFKKSKNVPFQTLEPVRPQTSILKSNINTKFSQQYQQQEKLYLKGITKYRNKYNNNDAYYDKSVIPDDLDVSGSSSIDSTDLGLGKLTLDSEIFNEDTVDRNNKEREYEALKALSQQIGSELLDKELDTFSEYTLDSNLLLELLNRNDEIQLQNTKVNGKITERLEWQVMLQTVLTGDVVTGEKTKIVKPMGELETENLLRVGLKEDLWIGIRAKLFGRTEEEQKRLVLYHRGLVDDIFKEIMTFKLSFPTDDEEMSYIDKVKFASKRVNCLLDKYEKCQELWRTQKEMEADKPQCATTEFVNRINCLVAWNSVTDAVERESDVLKKWVGNNDLDILRAADNSSTTNLVNNNIPASTSSQSLSSNSEHSDKTEHDTSHNENHIFKDDRPFVERILKDKDIENLFNKRLFTTFSHWTIKAKNSYLEYREYFNELGLPSYLDNLFVLTNFPSKLMKEIIKTRLAYADKLKNPTIMMIDQTIDDLKTYLRLALEIRISMLEYCAPVEGWISFPDYQDLEFDSTIIKSVNHYLTLLNRKLLFSPKGYKSFRTFKEPEELEKEWIFLQNMGFYINDISIELSLQIAKLFLKLTSRLYSFTQHQIQGPPSDGYRLDSQRLIRWYTSTIGNFGQLRRKFLRFESHMFQYFQNSILFKVLPQRTQKFFSLLKESNHALFHNPKIAEEGVYIFVSESLVNRPYDVECILNATYLGVDFTQIPEHHLEVIRSYHPTIDYYTRPDNDSVNDNETISSSLSNDYVIVIVPPKALMWDGPVVQFNDIDYLPIGELSRGYAMMITKGGPDVNVSENFSVFENFMNDTIGTNTQLLCCIPEIEESFQSSLKLFSRITCLTLDCIPTIRNQCRGVGNCQELVNNVFMFSRDIGRDSIRTNSILSGNLHSARGTIILRLIKLGIEWLSFIVDDCSPTDPKTFRWCVSALEFAMDVTRGFNILTLDSEKFYRLKDKVAGCMSLLIAHFDIMGARANELQKTRMMNYAYSTNKDIYTLDDESLGSLRQHIMLQIKEIENDRRLLQVEQKSVGRVLDNTDMENQLLTYLASSFSSVSIRWQKGKFLGGGTFGSVFACVNLDTGGPMAVKEIRFQDRQSIRTIVPAIKGEMSVLELLSHPNIVQFFGVEVHRDRVYIFMEYCSGGSLAGLLEYGRIEDELVIQLYTLQMLEGLAYLHQFGIVHRDVKPDNILLDHMGVIKFVDFGSAKVIAIPTTSSATPSSGNSTAAGGNTNNTNSVTSTNLSAAFNNNGNAGIPINEELNASNSNINGLAEEMNRSTSSTISSSMSLNEIINRSHNMNGGVGETNPSFKEEFNIKKTGLSANNDNPHALTGTPMYMAPETIKGEVSGKFGSMDIWSLGCCVLEMATGRRPWSNLDNEFAVMYHIAAGHLPLFPSKDELSVQGQEFLAKCLTIDPMKRATAVELLQDPWMQSIRNEAFSDQDV